MKHLITISCAILFALTACDDHNADCSFQLRVQLEQSLSRDSVTLWVFDEDYGKRIEIASAKNDNNVFLFKGQIDQPAPAYIQFDSVTPPLFFILSPDSISIDISPSNLIIHGGKQNHEYARFIAEHNNICRKIKKNNQEYVALIENRTLTQSQEMRMNQKDSLLQDSLQKHIVAGITQSHPAVAHIIQQRYFNLLDSAHISGLHAPSAQ